MVWAALRKQIGKGADLAMGVHPLATPNSSGLTSAEMLSAIVQPSLPARDAQAIAALVQIARTQAEAECSAHGATTLKEPAGSPVARRVVSTPEPARPKRRPTEPKRTNGPKPTEKSNTKPQPLSLQAKKAQAPKPVPDRRRTAWLYPRPAPRPSLARATAAPLDIDRQAA